jgi:chemotaxis response regulator CheB
MEKYMVDLLNNLDSHIKDKSVWEERNGHYIYNILKQVTPDVVMRNAENSGFFGRSMLQQLIQTQHPHCQAQIPT